MVGRLFGPVDLPLFSKDIITFTLCGSAGVIAALHLDNEENLEMIYSKI